MLGRCGPIRDRGEICIIRMIKLRMRLAGDVAGVGEMKNTREISVGKFGYHLRDQDVRGVILK